MEPNEPIPEPSLASADPPSKPPRIGVARGSFTVPDSFFEPLPDEILKAFNGE